MSSWQDRGAIAKRMSEKYQRLCLHALNPGHGICQEDSIKITPRIGYRVHISLVDLYSRRFRPLNPPILGDFFGVFPPELGG